MQYTVAEVARKTGLSPHTIRYYLKEGLFPSIERDPHGVRLFSQSDMETFYMIECLKNCGMTIREIRQYMSWLQEGDQNIEKCLNLFREKQQILAEKIHQLMGYGETVEYKIWFYETAREAGTLSVHETMREEDIPERMREIRAHIGRTLGLSDGKTLGKDD